MNLQQSGPLLLAALLFVGCQGEPHDDYISGPTPSVAATDSIERKRVLVKTPPPFYRTWKTRWIVNDETISPRERLAPLKLLIPDSLHDRLNETFKKRFAPDAVEVDCKKNFARACIVALNPDVLIITVRSYVPPNTSPHLFEETQIGAANWRSVRNKLELIDADSITMVYHAGQICCSSNEMYILSPDESIGFRALDFDGQRCEIELEDGKLVLIKDKEFATVQRIH